MGNSSQVAKDRITTTTKGYLKKYEDLDKCKKPDHNDCDETEETVVTLNSERKKVIVHTQKKTTS